MVDHQIAHVFVKPGYEEKVSLIFKKHEEVEDVLDKNKQKKLKIDHRNSGELILYANNDSWFNYYWWKDETLAPPFTFSVDIHRKPGYDPLELFFDPITKTISKDTLLIKGSHGVFEEKTDEELPIFIMSSKRQDVLNKINCTQIAPTITKLLGIEHVFPNNPIF